MLGLGDTSQVSIASSVAGAAPPATWYNTLIGNLFGGAIGGTIAGLTIGGLVIISLISGSNRR